MKDRQEFILNHLLLLKTKELATHDWAAGVDNSAKLDGDETWLMGIYKAEQERLEQAYAYVNRPASFRKMEVFE